MASHNCRMRRWPPRPARGVALVTALIVVAVAATIAFAVSTRDQIEIRRTENLLSLGQALQHARGVELWAAGVLRRDRQANTFDGPEDAWATPLPPIAVAGGSVSGRIEDLQGRYNINNLYSGDGAVESEVKFLTCLFEGLDIKPELIDAIVDWIDPDGVEVGPGGAEDSYYLRQKPARRAANTLFSDIAELQLVRGVTPEIYGALSPLLVAATPPQALNANSARPILLGCLMGPSAVSQVVQGRPWKKLADVTALEVFKDKPLPPNTLDVVSRLFEVYSVVRLSRAELAIRTRVFRDDGGNLSVLARHRGWPNG